MAQPIELLRKYWKHTQFRDPQEAIINNVLQGKDTFALLPTGGGKSICFQIPAISMPGICIVISPLIALIEDQVSNLSKIGIKATAIVGNNSIEDINITLDNCLYGGYKFLYIAPERLQQEWFLERLQKLPVNSIAIDEAHCVSQWGHDFRPAYLNIAKLKSLFPDKPFIALTASANKRTQQDIIDLLQLEKPKLFEKSFARQNLYYGVYQVENKEQTIFKILTKNPAPTIIYARNRRECQFFSTKLNQNNFKSTFFHGGLTTSEKKKRLQLWLDEETPIIVATNAFGMGIDKENVRNVIHIQIPENIENYYQEAGRAGRDGAKAFTTLLIGPQDIQQNNKLFSDALFDKEYLKLVYKKLNSFLKIAYGEGYNTQHSFNFNAFCNQYKLPLKKTFNALQFLDRQGIIKFSQNFGSKTHLQFITSSSRLLDYASTNESEETLMLFLVRNYPGISEYKTALNLEYVSKRTAIDIDLIRKTLSDWQEKELCIYEPEDNDISLVFYEIREDDRTLYRTFPYLKQQNILKQNQFQAMVFYVENTDICKNKIILNYFDEKTEDDCGICSTCISKKNNTNKNAIIDLSKQILSLIAHTELSVSEIEQHTNEKTQHIVSAIQLLLEANKIKPNEKNQYTIK